MSDLTLGTPKSLREMIERGICLSPASTLREDFIEGLRDFLSQKFQVAIYEAKSDEEVARLRELFEVIFKEDK